MRFTDYKKTTMRTAVLGMTILLLAVGLAFGQQQINLTAAGTTLTLPDGTIVPMWGYSCGAAVQNSTATCNALNPNAAGTWSPVVITVPTGQTLQINLTNNLSFLPTNATTPNNIPTSLVIVGQLGGGLGTSASSVPSPAHENMGTTWPIANGGPVWVPPSQGNRVQSLATEVPVGTTATALTWTTPRPGTYLLESGTHPSIQGPMGLYGIVVVTSTPGSGSPGATATTGCAYLATGGTCLASYNAELPLLFSEIDATQNKAVSKAVNTIGFSESATLGPYSAQPIASINLISGGSGYTSAPTVTFTPTTGGGAATAQIDTDPTSPTYQQVIGFTITNGGSYTSAPGVVISGGGGSGASADTALQLATSTTCVSGGAGGNVSAAACYPPAVNYTPLYYLINGVAFNKTSAGSSLFNAFPAPGTSGSVLVRMVNAGLRMHVPSIVGSLTSKTVGGTTSAVPGFSLMAEDGNLLPGVPRVQSEVFMAAGKTYDVMINVPAAGGTALPIFDRELSLSGNATARDAGMLAYISVNGASVPGAAEFGAAIANPDTYNSVVCTATSCNTVIVSDPAKGVIANDFNVYGVKIVGTGVSGKGTLTLNADGTLTYVPNAGFSGTDVFTYQANGNGPTTTITFGVAPIETAGGITCSFPTPTFTSTVATSLSIKPPGVLAFCKDAQGYPLTVATSPAPALAGGTLTMDPNGGFNASVTSAGSHSLTFSPQNSQGTVGASQTAYLSFPAPSGLKVTVMDPQTKAVVSDYRWIIEEDRTFFINPLCTTNDPTSQPPGCPGVVGTGGTVPTFGVNFHTSYMPVVATGCVAGGTAVSCEAGQTLLGQPAVCDIGNGVCRTTGSSQTPLDPSQVALDPTKRYYISVLPGDAANAFETGNGTGGHGMGGAPVACIPAPGTAACTSSGTFPAVTVLVEPNPFPPSKLSIMVFEDDFPLNGEQDAGGGVDVLSPNEPGLGGFNIELFDDAGGTGDPTGQMTYDMFNMPLSNSLAGTIDPVTGFDACPLSKSEMVGAGGAPSPTGIVGQIVTCPKFESDNATLSPLAGQAVVANLMPGRFGVVATPAADRIARGEEWLQTNTLDGQKAHDSFLRIGEPSYFQEYGPAGYHVSIGFANPQIINARHDPVCAGIKAGGGGCDNSIDGTVTGIRMSRTPDERLYDSGSRDTFSFTQCYVSLGDPDGADFMFTKCDSNGFFSFSNVPDGEWRLTLFDQWNDQIVDGLSTPANVSGGVPLHMKNIGVQQWQTNIYTTSFIDNDFTGTQDGTKPGLALVSTNVRFRDGSFSNFNNTDLMGNAGFNEVFPLFNWYVIESDSTRYKNTGTHVVYDAGGPADGSASCDPATAPCGNFSQPFMVNTAERVSLPTTPQNLRIPGAVYCDSTQAADCNGASIASGPIMGGSSGPDCTASATSPANTGYSVTCATALSTGRIDPPWVVSEGWQGFTGQNLYLDFGKKPFAPGETGGIRGHVIYASTRPFDDPQLLLQTSWEPLVPGVTINLYQEGTAADGSTSLRLIDTTTTTSWDNWAQGFRSDGIPNMNCPGQLSGTTTATAGDFFFYTLFDQPSYLDWYNSQHNGPTLTPLPYNSQFKCYDGMHNWNQLQPAPYDGMYSFPSVTSIVPTTGKPAGTNCHMYSQSEPWGCVPNTFVSTVATDPNYDPYRSGTAMLPAGKYVVEVVVPPGYELVKEEDKNILIGDNFIAPVTQQFGGLAYIFILPDQAEVASAYNSYNAQNPTQALGRTSFPSSEGDTGSVEVFWPCVGASRTVPDYISLFPQSAEVSPFAGATRNLCDRKEVTLTEQESALAKFYIFTSTHGTAHFTGVITDDFTSEFDPFAPAFGEKFAPPNLPISIKDWHGYEISRVYSDHFGLFDGLNYSTWEVNPPNPTGYSPTMMVTCMNDAGADPLHPDALFNPAYSDFCYEIPFMPAQTQYMDTPVVPTAAFAGGYNFPDCSYPDATPAIKSVTSQDIAGPWVSATGHSITITALGDVMVPDAGYSGPSASVAPFNMKKVNRHFGFGSTAGTVALVGSDGVPHNLTGVNWSDTTITGTVPSGVPNCAVQQQAQYGGPNGTTVTTAQCGQLVITAANGKQSVDTVTVTIGGKSPTLLTAPAPGTIVGPPGVIQSAIDKAKPGDLIIVPPGTYTEMVVMWKPVRLQGIGAASAVINANTQPAGTLLNPWRAQVTCLFGVALNGAPWGPGNQFDPSGQYSCPGTGWFGFQAVADVPQIDRLPLEAVVGWTATLNGNLAELLQEPTLMGAYEGAGITVLAKGLDFHGASPWSDGTEQGAFPAGTTLLVGTPNTTGVFPAGDANRLCKDGPRNTNRFPSNFQCNPSSIDGLSVTNSSQGGGGIFVHGWAHNLQIANNRVFNNAGTLSGGISVGQGEFPTPYTVGGINAAPGSCQTSTVTGKELPFCLDLHTNVHHNSVTNNSSIGDELFSATLAGGGGASFCTGTDYYQFNYNWVCGNLSSGEGGGLVHLGFIYNGDIEHNSILFNQSTNPTIPTNGGGIMVEGTPDTDPVCGTQPDADCPPGLSDGTGPNLVINANLIQGNSADSGSGGGLRLQSINGTEVSTFPGTPANWNSVNVTNNIIVDNVAGWDGAGVSLQDALNVNLLNNTITHNDSTATSGVLVNTLGAPLSSAPGGSCAQAGPTGLLTASCPQVSGLVSVPNTTLLTTTFTGLTITCPAGHYAPGTPANNGTCTQVSYPEMFNNVFWENRSFQIGVGGLGAGNQNQQKTVALYNPTSTFSRNGVGPAVASQGGANGTAGTTGICNDPNNQYWDIGIRGDASPTDNSGGATLAPVRSILTSLSGRYDGSINLAPSSVQFADGVGVVHQYCNGSRVPPECTPAMGCISGAGWAVPPGISDAVVPNPVFSLTPAATVDEGNNWINMTWGPLSLTNPALTGTDGNYGGGAPLGNYSICATGQPGCTSNSPALAYIPCTNGNANGSGCLVAAPAGTGQTTVLAPRKDFFGNPRPDANTPGAVKHIDVGAVELQIAQ